jgi:hypothetical protein
MNWTGQVTSSDQGLIIDDETGRTIAVAYDPKNTNLIAAAPNLLYEIKALMERAAQDAETYAPNGNEPIWAYIEDAADAIANAEKKS